MEDDGEDYDGGGDTPEPEDTSFEIGSVWPHKDGKGFDVQLEALPADG
jgi:hypothetical protein